MSESPPKIVARTRHGELTLDQLAEIQPGMARLMLEIGTRFQILYFAAKGGNWKLASHELAQVMNLMNVGGTTRPKFASDLKTFQQEYLTPLSEPIRNRDWRSFEELYSKAVQGLNSYHAKYGYTHIVYKISKSPPDFLDYSPKE